MLPLAFVLDVGGVIWALVGLVVIFCIVLFILRSLAAPAIAFTILYVVAGLLGLLLALNFFFGNQAVIVR